MSGKETWTEISDRLEALALKLRLHLEQANADNADNDVPKALGELRDKVENAFTAAGNAVHDDAVRADVRDVGQLVADALATALAKVNDDARKALERHR